MIKLKDILKEEKILVPRNLKNRDEGYKRVIYKQIQDYIKNGSKGNLYLFKTPITKLPDNFIEVKGNLDLNESLIQSLNNLQEIGGNLYLHSSKIKSLGNLQKVGGYLDLENTPIKSLGNLQEVKGYLFSNNSKIQSLGNLKFVGEDLYLQNTPLSKKYSKDEIFQMIKDKGIKVRGKIRI